MARIKICGITNREDYLHAVELGADYIGFIFFADSPRHVGTSQVKEITGGDRSQFFNPGGFINCWQMDQGNIPSTSKTISSQFYYWRVFSPFFRT